MKDGGKSREKISSLSASILSLALTVLGFSELTLNVWWHYPVAVIAIIVTYALFYFAVELLQFLNNIIRRAGVKTDTNAEFIELIESIDLLYYKVEQYNGAIIEEYKGVLEKEIADIYTKTSNKVSFIRQYRNSPILKSKGKLPDEQYLVSVENFCNAIKNNYSFAEQTE